MREILFRGKRYSDGEWVEGSLLAWPDGSTEMCYDNPESDDEFLKSIVYPETVGQYTGLTDKNGKKIFDGDIVRYEKADGTHEFYEVVWDNVFSAGMLQRIGSCQGFFIAGMNELVEVIGTIHDNPELLEVPHE